MPYFYDSYAIIEILKENKSYLEFKDAVITTTVLNLFEVYYYLLRVYNQKTADFLVRNFNFNFLELTPRVSIEASRFRFANKSKDLSLTDCVGYILSLNNNLKFLTGDSKFENVENVEFVK